MFKKRLSTTDLELTSLYEKTNTIPQCLIQYGEDLISSATIAYRHVEDPCFHTSRLVLKPMDSQAYIGIKSPEPCRT